MKPVSKTAFYCCGTRMIDAEQKKPLCGDTYAKRFMNHEGHEIVHRFRMLKKPNASTVCRHRIIDDLLKHEIALNPKVSIVLLGAGFDSRAFRLNGGNWVEVDDEAVIRYKNDRLPVNECNNQLVRISVDFRKSSVAETLRTLNLTPPVFFIIEGVSVYISETQMAALIGHMKSISNSHTVICDLQNACFYRWVSRRFEKVLKSMGVSFSPPMEIPESMFTSRGYQQIKKISIAEVCVRLGGYWIPTILMKTVFSKLKYGYSVFVFEHKGD